MAILGSTTLTGCQFIPSFLGGLDGSSRPFYTVFENASAPVSWTKDTSFSTNGIALRVTTGTVGSRTSQTFTQVFATKSIGLSVTQGTATPIATGSSSANITINQVVANPDIQLDLSLADIPAHTHSYDINRNRPASPGQIQGLGPTFDTVASGQAGGGGQHRHSISFGQHAHTVLSPHNHTVQAGQHSHTVPGPNSQENFLINYRDVIMAFKTVN